MDKSSNEALLEEINSLRCRLSEANDTLDAIRTGQVDALVVSDDNGHSLFTLKTADQSYRVFIEQMTEGAVTLTRSGLIVYSNSRFATMVGVPLSKVMGGYFFSFVADSFRLKFESLFMQGWEQNVRGEIDVRSGELDVSVLVSLNRSQFDDQMAMNIIITDLTSQKRIERQLQETNVQLRDLNQALLDSNHDLQQFASVASHDLQEPLRKIQVFSKFIKDRASHELSKPTMEYLDKIISSSVRMKVLIIDILTYSRLSASSVQKELVDLEALFGDILEDFELRIKDTGANVEIGALPNVEGNAGQLRQVFQNLISNALKFTARHREPTITIATQPVHAEDLKSLPGNQADYFKIVVADNGIGFDKQFSVRIFNLFEKLHANSFYEESGIGLAIAKKIIDKHHGLISAKSVVGYGSEFSIILPYKQRIESLEFKESHTG